MLSYTFTGYCRTKLNTTVVKTTTVSTLRELNQKNKTKTDEDSVKTGRTVEGTCSCRIHSLPSHIVNSTVFQLLQNRSFSTN